MRLKCLVCGHKFESSERYVILQSWVKHADGSGQGVQLAVCATSQRRDGRRLVTRYSIMERPYSPSICRA